MLGTCGDIYSSYRLLLLGHKCILFSEGNSPRLPQQSDLEVHKASSAPPQVSLGFENKDLNYISTGGRSACC